ncbi:MAG: glycosyltransferase family A protein [Pseudomonadota bacterium]
MNKSLPQDWRNGSGDTGRARIAVVIPYYQIDAGFLVRALQSVASQTILETGCSIDVLIVDDHSPHSPNSELEGFDQPPGLRTQLLQTQRNGGPAVARNVGLHSVVVDTDFVAFLDSDEVWTPNHLENALRTLTGASRDVYFSNYLRSDWTSDKFTITGFGDGHEPFDIERRLFLFSGCPLEEVLLKATVRIQTCVVRWAMVKELRFQESLMIGEDSEYVASAATRYGCGLCFSQSVETIEERVGVNVSQNRTGDTNKERQVRLRMLQYQVYLQREVDLPTPLVEKVSEALSEARYNALRAVLAPGSVCSRAGALARAVRIDHGFPLYVIRKVIESLRNAPKKTLSL